MNNHNTSLLSTFAVLSTFSSASLSAPICNKGDVFPGKLIPLGDAPREIAQADLDNDGDLDLVIANFQDHSITILHNNGSGAFDTESTLSPAGAFSSPEGIAIGDLDADGDPDIAVANFGSASIALMINDGTGLFTHAGNAPVGNQPKDVAIGQMNGEGFADLVVVNSMDNTVSVLLNNGDMTFTPLNAITTVITPQRLKLADMNADGNLDAVLLTDARVKLLDNDGTGQLTELMSTNLSTGPRDLDVGDIDGDTDLDIVVANRNVDHSSLLTNNNDGTFTASSITTGSEHRSIALTDMDNDGDLDLIAGDSINNLIRVLHNDGQGVFDSPTLYSGGENPWSITTGDFDDDGVLDLAAANRDSDDLAMLFGRGDGTLVDQDTFDSGIGEFAHSVDHADVDGDGDLDFVIAHRHPAPHPEAGENIQVFLNDGDGRFVEGVHFNSGVHPNSVHFVNVFDFPGEVGPDMLITNTASSNNVTIRLNNGSGTFFSEQQYFFTVRDFPISAAVGKITGTGRMDFVTANPDDHSVSVMFNAGNGTFPVFWETVISTGGRPFGIAVADLTNDTIDPKDPNGGPKMEIVVGLIDDGTATDRVEVYTQIGEHDNIQFSSPDTYTVGDSPRNISIGDLDGDTHPDIVVVCNDSHDVYVLLNNGTGQFTHHPNNPFPAGEKPISSQIADVDNDGDMDIFIANFFDETMPETKQERMHVLINDGSGDFSQIESYRTGSASRDLTVEDFDDDGFMDVVTTGDHPDTATVLLNNRRSIAYWSGPGSGFDEITNWFDEQSPVPEGSIFTDVIIDQTVGGFSIFPLINIESPVMLDSFGIANDVVTVNLFGNSITLLGDPGRPYSAALQVGLRQCGLGNAFPNDPPVLRLVNTNPTTATLTSPTLSVGTQGQGQLQLISQNNQIQFSVSDSVVVGDRASGELTLSGSNNSIVYGNADESINDSVIIGNHADGLIELDSGAVVNPTGAIHTDEFILAQDPGVTGTLQITGPDSTWNHLGSSIIFGNQGDAFIQILEGAQLLTQTANSISLATQPGSSAYVRVNGAGSLWSENPGEIHVGVQGDAMLEATDLGVISALSIKNHSRGVIESNSTIEAFTMFNFGDLVVGDPSISDPELADTMQIIGSLVQYDDPGNPQFSGRILLDIVSEGGGSIVADQLAVSQSASLAGTLVVTTQDDLSGLEVNDELVLITAGSPIGSARFELALLPGLPDGKYFQIQYDAVPGFEGSVSLVVETFNEFTLGDPSTFDPQSSPTNAVAGDLNGDGFDDLALVIPDQADPNNNPGQVIVLLNAQTTQSAGNWPGFIAGASLILQTEPNPTDLAIADLDQQFGNDLIVLSGATGNVKPFLSNGSVDITNRFSTTFPAIGFESTSPQSIEVADFDADGFPDVIVAGSTPAGSSAPGRVSVRLNMGTTGSWNGLEASIHHSAVELNPVDIAIADLNFQNGVDVAVANAGSDSVSLLQNQGTNTSTWLGLGTASNASVGAAPMNIFARDLDEEKDLDIVTFNQANQSMSILIQENPAAGQLGDAFAPSASIPLGGRPISATFWDGDNDGDQDPAVVLVTDEDERFVRLLRNLSAESGMLSFVLDADIAQKDGPLLILSGQLNADEGDDLAIIGASTAELFNEDPTSGIDTNNGSVYLGSFCTADLNNDAVLDFFDISVFLSEFANQSPLGDFNSDGEFDFFDISSFLTAYSDGCP
ncbi:MAG: FG-GAP-like repeat-containing protein [Phycisphaerales bacterium]